MSFCSGSLRCLLLVFATAACDAAAEGPLQQIRELEAVVRVNPSHASAVRELAHACALALLGPDAAAAKYAGAALDASKNVWILGNAAYMLQSTYNAGLQRGSPDKRAAALAEKYFARAQGLDPKLDRLSVLPKIDLEQLTQARAARAREKAEWDRRFDEAARRIRRLKPEAFPELPAQVAGVLRARGCTVPQPFGADRSRNVIRGEFFEAGQESWAVLCSVRGHSSILVFRDAQDSAPQALSRREDRGYLQGLGGDTVGYSRGISTVGRDFIVEHDRGYPVAKPPRIDHQGIDDAFLEKASEVWYFHAGKWFKLPGAD